MSILRTDKHIKSIVRNLTKELKITKNDLFLPILISENKTSLRKLIEK